jgi:hypothetical protein
MAIVGGLNRRQNLIGSASIKPPALLGIRYDWSPALENKGVEAPVNWEPFSY